MISSHAAATQTMKVNQVMHKFSLLVITMGAGLYLAANRNKGIMFELMCALGAALIPIAYAATRRWIRTSRQRRTEEGLLRNTWTYLRSQEAAAETHTAYAPPAAVTRKAQTMPAPGFRQIAVTAAKKAPAGELVVFDAITARARNAGRPPAIPGPAVLTFDELAPAALSEYECWRAERHHFAIEYACTVLDEIRVAAVEGYQRLRHGGIEVGGVLFGTHRDGVVRIQAARPIACEYAEGPRFILSERDQAGLAALLEASRHDAELQGLEPVGWYHSHTRSEILLSELDVEYFNQFFPRPWQVALVVRPSNLAPARAGFFFREANGLLRTESSYHEFQCSPPALSVAAA